MALTYPIHSSLGVIANFFCGYSETMDGSLYFKDACHEYWSELYFRLAGHLSDF